MRPSMPRSCRRRADDAGMRDNRGQGAKIAFDCHAGAEERRNQPEKWGSDLDGLAQRGAVLA